MKVLKIVLYKENESSGLGSNDKTTNQTVSIVENVIK